VNDAPRPTPGPNCSLGLTGRAPRASSPPARSAPGSSAFTLGMHTLPEVTMRMVVLVLLTSSFVTTTGLQSQDVPTDKQKIEGSWKVVSLEALGMKELPPDVLKAAKVVVTSDKLTIEIAGEKFETSYKLDPAKKPKAIDMVDLGRKDAKPTPGIYLLEGDE